MKILHLCPTFGNPTCGIARYSKRLYSGLQEYDDVEQIVSADPLTSVNTLLRRLDPEIVHLQYEYGFASSQRLQILTSQCEDRSIPLFITYHTLSTLPHNWVKGSRVTKLTHATPEYSDVYLGSNAFQVISPIPKIDPVTPANISPEKDSYLFFGQAHPHKGLSQLLVWFARNPEKNLTIIASKGPTHNPYWARCREEALRLKNVYWIDQYLEESEVLGVAQQCAAVILPYQEYGSIGVSAAAKLFLTLDIPVLLTRVSHFCDILESHDYQPVCVKRSSMEELLALNLGAIQCTGRVAYVEARTTKRFVHQHYSLYRGSQFDK